MTDGEKPKKLKKSITSLFNGLVLRAGPYRYKIIVDSGKIWQRSHENGDSEPNLGMCDHPRGEIILDPNQCNHSLLETLHHEWLHVAFYQSGLTHLFNAEDEEKIVGLLSPALLANMRMNSEFVMKLIED